MRTPPCLDRALSLIQNKDTAREGEGEEEEGLEGWRRRRGGG